MAYRNAVADGQGRLHPVGVCAAAAYPAYLGTAVAEHCLHPARSAAGGRNPQSICGLGRSARSRYCRWSLWLSEWCRYRSCQWFPWSTPVVPSCSILASVTRIDRIEGDGRNSVPAVPALAIVAAKAFVTVLLTVMISDIDHHFRFGLVQIVNQLLRRDLISSFVPRSFQGLLRVVGKAPRGSVVAVRTALANFLEIPAPEVVFVEVKPSFTRKSS